MSEFKRTELGEKVVKALIVCSNGTACCEGCTYSAANCERYRTEDALRYIQYLEGLLGGELAKEEDKPFYSDDKFERLFSIASGEIVLLKERLQDAEAEKNDLLETTRRQDREIVRLSEENENMGAYILHLIRNGIL